MTSRWIALGTLLAACQPPAPTVEPNDLGIAELVLDHGEVHGERLLTVRGFDHDGATIATATLRTGMVLYGADMKPELHPGTELAITVREINSKFVSPDRVPHVIYEPLQPAMATFLALHDVARAINAEAGIQFAPPQRASDEIAFTAGACDGSRFPTNKGGASQCCQDTNNTYHLNATNGVANRATYAPSYPSIPVCRQSDGTTGCTTNCMYGPCGSAVISVQGTNGHVFHPTSNPNACGWDTGGGVFSPEAYTSQTLYGAMTPTCTCTGCNADGTPQCGWSDDFNRTTGLGTLWTVPGKVGAWSTDGANAVGTGAANMARALPSPAIGTDTYAVTSRMAVPTGATCSGVDARMGGPSYTENTYIAKLTTEGAVDLERRNNWNWTHLTTYPVTVTPDTMYTVKLVASGSNPVHLEAWIDGTQKIVYEDWSASALATGGYGLQNYSANVKHDSFQIDPITPITPGPAPQTGSPFIDDFNRSTGFGSTNNWSVRWGSFNTDGSNAVSSLTSIHGNWARVIPDLGSLNAAITAVMSVPASTTFAGIFTRNAEPGDWSKSAYIARISTSGDLKLYRRTNWTNVQLGTYTTTITAGTFYTVKLVTTGSNPVHLEVWLDGVQRITYDDSATDRLTTGSHGLVNYKDGVKYDSYRADAL